MFDATYFSEHLREQHRKMEGSASTEVHLFDGTVFHIAQVGDAHEGYILLDAYPPAGDESTETERRAVAYESIAHIIVTTASVTEKRITGFQRGRT
jgi:hypothetical protein